MVKPTQPKGIKPKAEGGAPGEGGKSGLELSGMKLIIVNTVITIIICLLFVASNYFIVKTSLSSIKPAGEESAEGEEAAEGEGEELERGLILDLGEFILNLNDPNARRYLKINVALELSRLETDPVHKKVGSQLVNGGAAPDPMKQIEEEMNQFKPAIRDAVISILSSKTSEELSSIAGKELAKEQIKESVNAIFAGEREVLRVSFGNFIIQ